MKHFLILLLSVFLLSCGSDGGSDDAQTPATAGTAPEINSVTPGIRNSYGGHTPVDEFTIGDYGNFQVNFTDIDKDVSELELTQFYPHTAETPYYGPDIVPIGSQSSETMLISLAEDELITGPAGNWRAEFVLRDQGGNTSQTFVVFLQVKP